MGDNRKILIEIVTKTSGAEKKVKKTGDAVEKTGKQADKASKSFFGLGKTLGAIARGFIIVKGFQLLAQTISSTIKVAAEFELTMAKVKAISGATEEEFQKLTASARDLALGTTFTASQVGELQLAYSKLGFTTAEILAATEATLNLATATGEDLAGAADVVGATIRGFGLAATEAARVTDIMAAAFSSSALNLENFKQSMKTVAPIARAANIDLETTTALLGSLADAGLRGTRAATGLKNLMSQLTDPTSDLAQELGFTVKNSEGLIHAFKELSLKGIDLSDATGLVDERSKAAFITLVNGITNVEDLAIALGNSAGEAEAMAGVIENTLAGSFKILQSQIEETQIALTNTDFFKNSIDGLSVLLVLAREGQKEAANLIKEFGVAEQMDIEMKALIKGKADFDSKRKKANKKFAEENAAILEESLDKEEAANIIRERHTERRKEQEEEYVKFATSQQALLQEKRGRFLKAIEEAQDNGHAARVAQIEEEIRLENKKQITNESDEQNHIARLKILKNRLKDVKEEHQDHLQEITKTRAYVVNFEVLQKLGKEYDKYTKSVKDTTKANAELSDIIEDVNLDKEVEKTYDWGVAWASVNEETGKFSTEDSIVGDDFSKNLNGLIKDYGKLTEKTTEFIEKMEEAEQKGGGFFFRLAVDVVGFIDDYSDQILQFAELSNSLNDIFQVRSQNRLNAIVTENDFELDLFNRKQDEILERYDIDQKEEIALFEGTQEQKAQFEKQKDLERLEFEKQQEQERQALRKKQLAKENEVARSAFNANKANSIGQIAIDTAVAIAKTIAQLGGVGAITPAGAALIALMGATGAAQAAAVGSEKFQPKTFQDGGMIEGASHSEGGVPFTVAGRAGFEAEGGEYIFSKNTVDRLGTGLLDAINFGGAAPRLFADGGAVSRASVASSAMNQSEMAQMIGEVVASSVAQIPVVNVATETDSLSRMVQNAEAMATI
jgi:TP901 family phage tail tape measure protein